MKKDTKLNKVSLKDLEDPECITSVCYDCRVPHHLCNLIHIYIPRNHIHILVFSDRCTGLGIHP